MKELIINNIQDSIHLKKQVLNDELILEQIAIASTTIIQSLKNGAKLLLCGNGGSAADAQHLTAELVSKFRLERRGIPAISLNTNTSILTAITNDYEFERVFSRQVEAIGANGDVIIGISTSGNSRNVLMAMKKAQEMGIKTIGFLGNNGGSIIDYCELPIIIPGENTPRIQEVHIMIGHIICELVERELAILQ